MMKSSRLLAAVFGIFFFLSPAGPSEARVESGGAAIGADCTVDLVWGHGDEVRDAFRRREYSDHNIGQGCGLGARSGLKTAIYQDGFNGEWMGSLEPEHNGGLNPILSADNVRTRFSKDRADYEEDEMLAAIRILGQPGVTLDMHGLLRAVNAVGFMRMTRYHWSAVMKKSSELIESGQCSQVKMRFECESPDMTTKTWRRRIKLANGSFISDSKTRSSVVDHSGRNIFLQNLNCGKDSQGRKLMSLPLTCGESHVVDAAVMQALRIGPCGALMEQVSTGFSSRTGWKHALRRLYWQ